MPSSFEDLVVWQRAVALSVQIYRKTKELRDFGFRDQITRAGLSIPSNIAEGVERFTAADKIRFLDYARGSCAEVRTQTIVGREVGFLSAEDAELWCNETRQIAAMIQGLIRSIRNTSVRETSEVYQTPLQLSAINFQQTSAPPLLPNYHTEN